MFSLRRAETATTTFAQPVVGDETLLRSGRARQRCQLRWADRYLTLTSDRLVCSRKRHGVVDGDLVFPGHPDFATELRNVRAVTGSGTETTFEVHTSQRVVQFRAASAAERNGWLEAVEAACERCKTSHTLGPPPPEEKPSSFCFDSVDVLWARPPSHEEEALAIREELAGARARAQTQGSTPSFSPPGTEAMTVGGSEGEKPSSLDSSTTAGPTETSLREASALAEVDTAEAGVEAGAEAASLPEFGLEPLREASGLSQSTDEGDDLAPLPVLAAAAAEGPAAAAAPSFDGPHFAAAELSGSGAAGGSFSGRVPVTPRRETLQEAWAAINGRRADTKDLVACECTTAAAERAITSKADSRLLHESDDAATEHQAFVADLSRCLPGCLNPAGGVHHARCPNHQRQAAAKPAEEDGSSASTPATRTLIHEDEPRGQRSVKASLPDSTVVLTQEPAATSGGEGPTLLGRVGGAAAALERGSLEAVWASIHKNRQEEVVFEAHCKGPALAGPRAGAVRPSTPRGFLPSAPGDASWVH